ncbi:hypothetical protein QR680_017373 [Steinernema hermaphroditum]|uniref:Carboxylesterase type B domain-containing protein n=1 Tax=Steinernema hermaphroditum TaxID=289476 RepID=A0AA39HFB8_9BILA|nr:hypothetical protein QR680_017373 [Steinernema hermaphroditum]
MDLFEMGLALYHIMRIPLLFGVLVALVLATKPEEDFRVRQLSVGDLQGRQVTTQSDKTVYAYLGIPYANAPIGDLRFKEPETKRKWDGVLDATEYKVSCPYNSSFMSNTRESKFMSEDCLQANVFASENCLREGACPVLVYLFPSELYFGSAVMIEERRVAEDWASEDLVVVTFNHRLGVFGLLNLGTETSTDASTDAALQDQIAALQWTQKHIEKFGADPRHVTLMSVGSGAANADLLALSPKTKGLFNQMVLIDGAAGLYNNSDRETNERSSKNIAVKIGCATLAGWGKKEKAKETLRCLREHRAGDLLEVQRQLEDYLERVPFDGPAVNPKGVLPKKLGDLQKMRRPMPILLGSTGRLPSTQKEAKIDDRDFCSQAANFKNLVLSKRLLKGCKKMYKHDVEEAFDEVTVTLPMLETSRKNAENGGKTYLFETHSAFDENLHLKDRKENTRLKETILHFLKTGDPSDEKDNTEWKPFDTKKGNYMRMRGDAMENADGYHEKADDFWNNKTLSEKEEDETEKKKTEEEEEQERHPDEEKKKHREEKETEEEEKETEEKRYWKEKQRKRHTEEEKKKHREEKETERPEKKHHQKERETEHGERRRWIEKERQKEREEERRHWKEHEKKGEEKWKVRNMTKEEVLETVEEMQKQIRSLRDRMKTDEDDFSGWKEDVDETLKTLTERMQHLKKHKPTPTRRHQQRYEKEHKKAEEEWEPKGHWKVRHGKWEDVKGREREQVLRQVAAIERDIEEIFEELGIDAPPSLHRDSGVRNAAPSLVTGNGSDATVPSVVVYRDAGWNLWFWIVFALFVVLLVVLMITCFFLVTAKQKKGEYSQIS